jgi:hypothetical protein
MHRDFPSNYEKSWRILYITLQVAAIVRLIFMFVEGVSQLLGRGAKRGVDGKRCKRNNERAYGNDKNCCRLHKISFRLKHCNLIILRIIKWRIGSRTHGTRNAARQLAQAFEF